MPQRRFSAGKIPRSTHIRIRYYFTHPRPSAERVPTKEETDKREMQDRRLMLLNKDRRAEAFAELEAQDAEKERECALAENARRRQAATGIFLCLLELKRPVEAAEAAWVRLGLCETEEERREVKQPKARVSVALSSRKLCISVLLDTKPNSLQADGVARDISKLEIITISYCNIPCHPKHT